MAKKDEVLKIYDEQFVRMWEFYLAGSEMAFTHENFVIMQIQLVQNNNAVPITRDYIAKEEARLKAWETVRAPLEPLDY